MVRAFIVLALFLIASSVPALGQRSGKGPMFTEPPKNDKSFELIGEFLGPIRKGENKYEPIALQIRCIGSDNFEAVVFKGGLPGQPKHQPKMMNMIGRRNGDLVILSGGPWAIFVQKDHCLIVDPTGKTLGRLERVNRKSPTMGAVAPTGSVVIFDGSNLDQFTSAQMSKDGLLMEGAHLKPMFQDFNMHVEFRIPYMPIAQGQQRGNSGLYLQGRYECQVLDSFALGRLINGLGALYQQKAPEVNMALPPLVWQTYDVQFTAPRWAADGSKIRNAHITSWINGVKVQDNVSLPNKTGAGKQEEPTLLPCLIQNHGDPVRFRNIWIVDRGLSKGPFPVMSPKKKTPKVIEAKPPKLDESEAKKPKMDAKPQPEKSNSKPEPKPAPEKDAKPGSKKPKSKPEPKKEAKPKAKKLESKPEPKPATEKDAKPGSKKPKSKPETKPASKKKAKPESKKASDSKNQAAKSPAKKETVKKDSTKQEPKPSDDQ